MRRKKKYKPNSRLTLFSQPDVSTNFTINIDIGRVYVSRIQMWFTSSKISVASDKGHRYFKHSTENGTDTVFKATQGYKAFCDWFPNATVKELNITIKSTHDNIDTRFTYTGEYSLEEANLVYANALNSMGHVIGERYYLDTDSKEFRSIKRDEFTSKHAGP